MKKMLFILSVFLISSSLFANYKNPFWDDGYLNLVKINNRFKPSFFQVYTSVSFDSVRASYTGFFYEFRTKMLLSGHLGFFGNLRLGPDYPVLKIVDFGTEFIPLSFLKFNLNYKYRDFFKYRIGEHNLVFKSAIPFNTLKYVSFELVQGINMRFIDVDTFNKGIEYKKDWLFVMFFLWQFNLMIHPVFVYSCGISIGNIDEFELFSLNYWQFEGINYFHLPKRVSLYAGGGFAYAGSFPFAGIINRFWIRLGVRYEFKFH